MSTKSIHPACLIAGILLCAIAWSQPMPRGQRHESGTLTSHQRGELVAEILSSASAGATQSVGGTTTTEEFAVAPNAESSDGVAPGYGSTGGSGVFMGPVYSYSRGYGSAGSYGWSTTYGSAGGYGFAPMRRPLRAFRSRWFGRRGLGCVGVVSTTWVAPSVSVPVTMGPVWSAPFVAAPVVAAPSVIRQRTVCRGGTCVLVP